MKGFFHRLRPYIREHRAVFAVYVVLRLIVLACLVLSAADGNWENVFVCILDALALVGFRRSLFTDLCCNLTNQLLVDTLYEDRVLVGGFKSNTVDFGHNNRVGIAEVHDELLAFLCNSVTDAVDFELLFVALDNTFDHVCDESSGQTVQSAVFLFIVGTDDVDFSCSDFDRHVRMNCLR